MCCSTHILSSKPKHQLLEYLLLRTHSHAPHYKFPSITKTAFQKVLPLHTPSRFWPRVNDCLSQGYTDASLLLWIITTLKGHLSSRASCRISQSLDVNCTWVSFSFCPNLTFCISRDDSPVNLHISCHRVCFQGTQSKTELKSFYYFSHLFNYEITPFQNWSKCIIAFPSSLNWYEI